MRCWTCGRGAVLLLDLAEVFAIADRLVVRRKGQIAGAMTAVDFDIDQIGRWMSGAHDDHAATGAGAMPPAETPASQEEVA